MLKIRLQRHGKKGKPVYYIVVVDSRAPRDGGNVIEKLGHYNPQACGQDPIYRFNLENLNAWVAKGAQPTDTVRGLARKGRKQTPVNGIVESYAKPIAAPAA